MITCSACRDAGPLPCLCAVVEHAAASLGSALPRLLALPLCPQRREDGAACLAPVLPVPGRCGRLTCLDGHAWHEGGRQGEAAPLWSEATRTLEAWRRRDRGSVRVERGRWVVVERDGGGRWMARR